MGDSNKFVKQADCVTAGLINLRRLLNGYALEDRHLCYVVRRSLGEHVPEARVREASTRVVPTQHTPTTHESKSCWRTCADRTDVVHAALNTQ